MRSRRYGKAGIEQAMGLRKETVVLHTQTGREEDSMGAPRRTDQDARWQMAGTCATEMMMTMQDRGWLGLPLFSSTGAARDYG